MADVSPIAVKHLRDMDLVMDFVRLIVNVFILLVLLNPKSPNPTPTDTWGPTPAEFEVFPNPTPTYNRGPTPAEFEDFRYYGKTLPFGDSSFDKDRMSRDLSPNPQA